MHMVYIDTVIPSILHTLTPLICFFFSVIGKRKMSKKESAMNLMKPPVSFRISIVIRKT